MNDTEALALPEGETISVALRARMFEGLAQYVAPKRRATELTMHRGENQMVNLQLQPSLLAKLKKERGEDEEEFIQEMREAWQAEGG